MPNKKIHPGDQFVPTAKNMAQILDGYGLKFQTYREADSGIENQTIIVDTDHGKFIVRIYRQGKKKSVAAQLEVDFMQYLRLCDIKVPQIIEDKASRNLSTTQADGKDWQVIIMEHAKGTHPQTYTQQLLRDLATAQATMHTLAQSYTGQVNSKDKLTQLQEDRFVSHIQLAGIRSPQLRQFLDRVRNFRLTLDSRLPAGLCHMDYDIENVLSHNGTLSAILDFDDLTLAPFVVCLAYTLYDIHVSTAKKAVKTYLGQYSAVRQLSSLEHEYIKPVMLFRHYVVSVLDVLDGRTEPEDIRGYLTIEKELLTPGQP